MLLIFPIFLHNFPWIQSWSIHVNRGWGGWSQQIKISVKKRSPHAAKTWVLCPKVMLKRFWEHAHYEITWICFIYEVPRLARNRDGRAQFPLSQIFGVKRMGFADKGEWANIFAFLTLCLRALHGKNRHQKAFIPLNIQCVSELLTPPPPFKRGLAQDLPVRSRRSLRHPIHHMRVHEPFRSLWPWFTSVTLWRSGVKSQKVTFPYCRYPITQVTAEITQGHQLRYVDEITFAESIAVEIVGWILR